MNESDNMGFLNEQLYGGAEPSSNRQKTREEIIREVTEGGGEEDAKKNFLVIPISVGGDADVAETAAAFNVAQGSKAYEVLKVFCEEKTATSVQAKALMQRVASLKDEQWNLLRRVCERQDFRAKDILNFVLVLKKFGSVRLLMLHGFLGLEGAGPAALERFFIAAIPQSVPDIAGQEAYEAELREKAMTRIQIDVFYNICTRLPGIFSGTALALLPKLRELKNQHSVMLNTFLKKGTCFGPKPIDNQTIPGLINLWLSLPELRDKSRIKALIKKISRQPDKKKMDFQFIVHAFKTEVEKENPPSGKGLIAAARKIIN